MLSHTGKYRGKYTWTFQLVSFQNTKGSIGVFKLKRSLCGLKEDAHVWHDLLVSCLTDLQLYELENAACIFKTDSLILVLYVDDLILLRQTDSEINESVRPLSKNLKIKHLGVPTRFSSIEVTLETSDEVSMNEAMLANELLLQTVIAICRIMDSLMVPTISYRAQLNAP